MANTVIQLKHSTLTGNVPSSLANGEISINSRDGKFFYSTPTGSVITHYPYLGPAGLNKEIQFNDSGTLGSNSGLAFDKTSGSLNVSTTLNVSGRDLGAYANAAFLKANAPSDVANSAASYANSAFLRANSSLTSANGTIIWNTANAAFTRANNSLNANTGGTVAGQIVVDAGTYGNVTINQFASVYGQAYGPNPYSIVQVRSSDYVTGMGMQVYAGLNGLLYSNTGIQFNTSVNVRDKDFPTGGTNAGQFAANGAFIAQASLASTSNTTGSIQVVGGIGVKGNVSANGIIFDDGTRQTTAASGGATLGDVLALSIALG